MKKRSAKAARALAGVTIAAAATTSTAGRAEEVKLAEIAHVPATAAAKVRTVKVDGKDAVEVSGPGTAVRLDCTGALAGGKALSSVKVGIRHVDKGTHAFEIALVGGGKPATPAKAGIQDDTVKPAAKVGLLCDAKPAAKVGLVCNAKPSAKAGLLCNGRGAATIKPEFAGAKTFSVKVTKSGKTVQALTGQTGALTIADFDDVHDGHTETLGVTIAYGLERKGAWSIQLEHEEYTIVITAEGAQAPLVGGQLALSTSGLESVTLVGQKVEAAAALAAPAVPAGATLAK